MSRPFSTWADTPQCWAHCRRGFEQAKAAEPAASAEEARALLTEASPEGDEEPSIAASDEMEAALREAEQLWPVAREVNLELVEADPEELYARLRSLRGGLTSMTRIDLSSDGHCGLRSRG